MDIELLPNTTPYLEKRIVTIEKINKYRFSSLQNNEAMKKHSKSHYDHQVYPHTISEGDLALVYDTTNETLGLGKIETLQWDPLLSSTT
jgi:hypothetical protein